MSHLILSTQHADYDGAAPEPYLYTYTDSLPLAGVRLFGTGVNAVHIHSSDPAKLPAVAAAFAEAADHLTVQLDNENRTTDQEG